MRDGARKRGAALGLAFLLAGAASGAPADAGGLAFEREAMFDFAALPTFRGLGNDRYEIRFASKGQCDATVAVLNSEGVIVRHLASGVLGPNAPAPFRPGSLGQTLIWDGKNDLGRYVEQPEGCRAQVSLGLKPTLDKVLYWHPNRSGWATHGLASDADGVYVFDAGDNLTVTTGHQPCDDSQIRVYDHAGNYRRTIMPFARDKVLPHAYAPSPMHGQEAVPADRKSVGREGPPYGLVLPTGESIISSDRNGNYFKPLAPNSLAVVDGVVWGVLAVHQDSRFRFFRLKTDGTMPEGGYFSPSVGDRGLVGPCWMAASPDRKWVYLSGVAARHRDAYQSSKWVYGERDRADTARHALYRAPFDLNGDATVFAGKEGASGADNDHLSFPEGVDCDREGRVYVADTANNRVQVFGSDGKWLKTLAVESPTVARVHPVTGAIYAMSCPIKLGYCKLIKWKSLAEPTVAAEQKFDANARGIAFIPTFCIDPLAKETVIWLTRPDAVCSVQLWADMGERFELRRDLYADLRKEWKGPIPRNTGDFTSGGNNGNLTADPFHPYLYLGDTRGGAPLGRRINTDTGEVEETKGATVVGYDGLAYIRQGNRIARYNPETWKPVAFDYGEGAEGMLRYLYSSDDGIGIGISPLGDVLFHDRYPPVAGLVLNEHVMELNQKKVPSYMRPSDWAYGGVTSLDGYNVRQVFPGGLYRGAAAVLVFDRSGQLRSNDIIQGVPRLSSGVRMNLAGSIYVGLPMAKMVNGQVIMGHSVAKFGPKGGRIMVEGPGVPVPLHDPPARPADFRPLMASRTPVGEETGPDGKTKGYGQRAWAEGMQWSFGGYYPFNTEYCVCLTARFDLDLYGRLFVPESFRQSVAIMDTGGNFILRVGGYGNADDRGPDIRLAHCRFVAVNDKRLYINDAVNRRILSVNLGYAKEAVAALATGAAGPPAPPSR